MPPRTLIVGLGSPHGDDQAGWLAARRLAADRRPGGDVEVREAAAPTDLFDWLDGAARLVVCDACVGSGPLGTVRRWTRSELRSAAVRGSGTHQVPLPAVLALAERLGRLPSRVAVWTVEAAATAPGDELSSAVEAALPRLVAAIEQELADA